MLLEHPTPSLRGGLLASVGWPLCPPAQKGTVLCTGCRVARQPGMDAVEELTENNPLARFRPRCLSSNIQEEREFGADDSPRRCSMKPPLRTVLLGTKVSEEGTASRLAKTTGLYLAPIHSARAVRHALSICDRIRRFPRVEPGRSRAEGTGAIGVARQSPCAVLKQVPEAVGAGFEC